MKRLSVWLLGNGTAAAKLSKEKQAKIVKCSESLWKLTYYASVQFCVLAITYHEPWFRDTIEYFRGWPNQELKSNKGAILSEGRPTSRLPKKERTRSCQIDLHARHIAALVTWETRRKDFSIMMSHHIVTTVLIGYSYIASFFRIGSIILALHDASDVFMEAAKVFKYCENELGASLFFGLFALSWLVLRLIFFPFWVIFASRQLKNRGKVGEDIRSDSEDEDG
ncbi:hypothetical protein ACLOJK_013728 [Asimina triloba]